MNLRQMVLDSLRRGTPLPRILDHHSISEHDLLQIVANEMSVPFPRHMAEYLKLQEMEKLWGEYSSKMSLPSPEAWSMLQTQRASFHLAMELEIRRLTGIVTHPEVRPMVEAFGQELEKGFQKTLRGGRSSRKASR